jgi:hypothetical protein
MSTTPRSVVSFKADSDLRQWLRDRAKAGYRTVSAEVIMILEAAKRAELAPPGEEG